MASITEEAERIRQCKGRVFALHDEPEVPRVWLPFDDAPGLAMARAFGDFCLKDYGVIAVPELSHRVLTDQDQFIVLATDGVCPQSPSCFVLLKAAIVICLSNSSAEPIDDLHPT
jgi:serine/threonine protein phosphatase PrpC